LAHRTHTYIGRLGHIILPNPSNSMRFERAIVLKVGHLLDKTVLSTPHRANSQSLSDLAPMLCIFLEQFGYTWTSVNLQLLSLLLWFQNCLISALESTLSNTDQWHQPTSTLVETAVCQNW